MTEADRQEEENMLNLRSQNDDAIQSLLAMLDLSQGFTIAFAECNFWQDGVALVAALNDAASDPEWEELQLESWEFNDPDLRYLLDELLKHLETLPRQEGKKLVLVLRGLENAIGVVGEYPRFLVDLNFVRDAYARMVPHPVVFVLPDYAITRVANFAPDFWAWKSSVFKFQTSTEARDFALDKINSDRILGNYLKPEKQERIDLLHRLLMEANPSGSDPESNRNTAGQINILNGLGRAYDSLSEFQRAIDFYNQALELSRKFVDLDGEATSLEGLGNTYFSLGYCQQAIQFHHQALEIARKIGNRDSEATSLINLGNAYDSLGQHQQAIQFYHQSLEIARKIGDLGSESASFNNLGNSYYSLGQYQQAIQFYDQSLEIARKIGDYNTEASSLNNLGSTYDSLKKYQQAIQFYQQSLEITRRIGNRNGEKSSLVNLGNSYYSLGQYQQAVQFYQQSLEIARAIGDSDGEAGSLNNLGFALEQINRRSESLDAFKDSKQIYEELDRSEF
jgi:tetratricopeptide (TPR) repeat protein